MMLVLQIVGLVIAAGVWTVAVAQLRIAKSQEAGIAAGQAEAREANDMLRAQQDHVAQLVAMRTAWEAEARKHAEVCERRWAERELRIQHQGPS